MAMVNSVIISLSVSIFIFHQDAALADTDLCRLRTNHKSGMFNSKRKPLDEIWDGEYYRDIGNIVRFSPSACNTQPWKVTTEEKALTVYRYKKPGKRGIMPADKVAHYNRIDIGIFLCFLELCLMENNIDFNRGIFTDFAEDDCEEVLIAKYILP